MDDHEARSPDLPADASFDVVYRGLTVELVLHPPAPGTGPPAADEIVAALERTPLERVQRGSINRALDELATAEADVRFVAGTVSVSRGVIEPCEIVISRDGLAAYAIPTNPTARNEPRVESPAPVAGDGDDAVAPATDAGDAAASATDAGDAAASATDADDGADTHVSTALLRTLLTANHVVVGVLDDVVDGFGGGQPLHDVVCVARGVDPVPGRDAELTYHFDPHPRLIPRELEDGSVDFHSLLIERFIAEGTELVTLQPAEIGSPGRTVTGSRIDIPSVRQIDLRDLSGEQTEVQEERLVAVAGGRPVQATTGKIDVMPIFEVRGDLNYGVGNIDFPGDVVIRGDVRPGFTIRADGDVAVRGFVEGATIVAGHDLAVAGVVGERDSRFEVGGDLAAGYLHGTDARVTGTVAVRREIVNSTVTAKRITTSSSGRVVGGTVTAEEEIDAGSLGGANGQLTEIAVTSRDPTAVIRARRGAQPGTVMHIGGVRRQLEDELEAASFWEVGGTIISLPAAIDEDEVRKLRESPEQHDAA